MNRLETTRQAAVRGARVSASAGIVIAAVGGAIAATVLTLATVSFFTPDTWPSWSAPAVVEQTIAPVSWQGDPVEEAIRADDPAVAIAALQLALAEAEGEREQLSTSLVTLNREVIALDVALETLLKDDLNGLADPVNDDEASEADPTALQTSGVETETPQQRRRRGIAENLVAAGLDPDTAAELQQRQNAWQLERLNLIDLAAREGYSDTDRLDQELDALSDERPNLRSELGDDAWDRYLYEAGRRNRVSIASVIPGSTAEVAGLQVGDTVLAYSESRVFTPNDLQEATQSGSRGEPVVVLIERGGSQQIMDVVRGPLGVTLSRQRVEP